MSKIGLIIILFAFYLGGSIGCPENEEYQNCVDRCREKRCDTIGKVINCPDRPTKCISGCTCKKHFWRNSKGKCVDVRQCPPLDCSNRNGIFSYCPPYCRDFSCKSLYIHRVCPAIANTECNPGCICKDGFLMNSQGVCVRKEECPEYCSKNNTIYNPCGKECEITCENQHDPPVCDESTCEGPPSCICAYGYARNYKGQCVPKNKCTLKCPRREIYNDCSGTFRENRCDNLAEINQFKCIPGCTCKENYWRNYRGQCVHYHKCFPVKCSDKNAIVDPCPHNDFSDDCIPNCVCKDGYSPDDDGKCIRTFW